MARLARGGTEVLIVHSEWDPGNDYFHRILRPGFVREEGSAGVEFQVIEGADHDFSLLRLRESCSGSSRNGWFAGSRVDRGRSTVTGADEARVEAERAMNGGRPLRIAMIAACPFPSPRGTPIRIFRMAEALAHLGHEVHVATYHIGDDTGPLPFEVHRIPHVSFYRRSDPGPTYGKLMVLDPLLGRSLRRLIRTARFDVIHAHHYEGLLVAKSLPARIGRPSSTMRTPCSRRSSRTIGWASDGGSSARWAGSWTTGSPDPPLT
jgi:hypothetical protein